MFSIRINGMSHGFFGSKRFVSVMEYLNRALKVAVMQKGFRFHPGYHGLKLCMLSLADDLLFFCKADLRRVRIMITAFKHFSDCSGLEANVAK